jgi:hypothetical protein
MDGFRKKKTNLNSPVRHIMDSRSEKISKNKTAAHGVL